MVWKLENSMVRLMAAMMACFEADRMADSPVILTVLRKDGYLVGMWVGILVEMKENYRVAHWVQKSVIVSVETWVVRWVELLAVCWVGR